MTDWIALLISFAVCFAAAGIGGMFTTRSIQSWYRGLRKPSWNPPDWAFGPVFDSPEDAGAFCAWLGTDPRNIMLRAILDGKEPDAALEARYLDWRIHQQQAGA